MFFILSKILWIVTDPANLLLGLTALGVFGGFHAEQDGVGSPTPSCSPSEEKEAELRGKTHATLLRRWARRLVGGSVVLLLAFGFSPLGAMLLRPLEDRFPAPMLAGLSPSGIIVLGGPIDQVVGAARGQVTIADAATRLTAGVALARRFPSAKLIYTGGSNALVSDIGAEAEDARRLWIDLGIAPDRIMIEEKSRNTDENARFTRDILKPTARQTFVLVTSAYHMARSVGLFRAAGVPVIPDPVDYRTTGTARDLMPHADAVAGLRQVDVAAREWIGLLAYWLSGRIAEPFPGPGTGSESGGSSRTAAASASE